MCQHGETRCNLSRMPCSACKHNAMNDATNAQIIATILALGPLRMQSRAPITRHSCAPTPLRRDRMPFGPLGSLSGRLWFSPGKAKESEGKRRKAKSCKGRQREATEARGDEGRRRRQRQQREAKGGKATQRDATRSARKGNEAKGVKSKQTEAKESTRRQRESCRRRVTNIAEDPRCRAVNSSCALFPSRVCSIFVFPYVRERIPKRQPQQR